MQVNIQPIPADLEQVLRMYASGRWTHPLQTMQAVSALLVEIEALRELVAKLTTPKEKKGRQGVQEDSHPAA